ncbi:MAG: glycogen/starch/alpha-glucan phosphorylase [Eubacteriales bacterium]|nr:glycogen/starch/alpha-glucan phosphorylase [Eubacteriales bacterium]
MNDKKITKKRIKQLVIEKLRSLFAQEIETASQHQLFIAVCAMVSDFINDFWLETKKAIRTHDAKTVYYMSMEFLVGRALGNNLINLEAWEKVRDALRELGVDLNALEDEERDPSLGNGGLGRLAACFLESLSTLFYSAVGCSIRYHYGMFRQVIVNGAQHEVPDDWMDGGYPFEIRRPEEARVVRFGGYVETVYNECKGGYEFVHKGYSEVLAVPYDMPVIGYGNGHVNTLRLWDAEAITSDDWDYDKIMEQRRNAEQLTGVLYPDDTKDGGALRLRQQYFFVSASVQNAVADYKKTHDDITKLPEKVVFQLNDTHPAVTTAELMRVLMDEEGLGWDAAWEVTTKCLGFSNHTRLIEALEQWPVALFERLLPRITQIIREINRRFVMEIKDRYPDDPDRIRRMAVIHDDAVRMANLAVVTCFSVNGVARIHTRILKEELFLDFYEMMPHKFKNMTNGVTQRRFLLHGNPELAEWITGRIGPSWITNYSEIRKVAAFADDKKELIKLMTIKLDNKERLADYILKNNGVKVDPYSIFDVQVKRSHEYKRSILLVLYIIYLYDQVKKDPIRYSYHPRTFIIGGKAAASYYMAKLTIKLINSVAEVINNDASVNGRIKVIYIEDYRVSNAELIFAAANVSENISTASFEASGTGVMKMMMQGAVLCGTMDGANVEIVEEAGLENEFVFGLSADQVIGYQKNGGYDPKAIFDSDADIRRVLTRLVDGTFSPDKEEFRDIYNSLLFGRNGDSPDRFFVLADLRPFIETQERIERAYRDPYRWAKMSLLNTAYSGRFSSDRTIEEYVREIWHLEKAASSRNPEKNEEKT